MNVVFAKRMVHSLLSNFCTNLLELIQFGKLTIEYVLSHIQLQQFLKAIQQRQTVNRFLWLFQYWELCLKWHWCFQDPISSWDGCTGHVVKRKLTLYITYRTYMKFEALFLNFFAFQRATSLVLQRDISFLFQHQFCLMPYVLVVHLNSM